MLEGKALREDEVGIVRLDEGTEDDNGLGQESDERDDGHGQGHQEPRKPVVFRDCRRAKRAHLIVPAGDPPLLDEENEQRDDDDDHRDGAGEVGVAARLAQILIVDENRQGTEVAAGQDAGRTEVGERCHKDHQRTGGDGGHDHRQRNGQDPPERRGTEVLTGLLQRGIDR